MMHGATAAPDSDALAAVSARVWDKAAEGWNRNTGAIQGWLCDITMSAGKRREELFSGAPINRVNLFSLHSRQ